MTTTVVLADLAEFLDLAVREVVRDWSAVGLLAPSVWVDLGQLDAASWDVPVLCVSGTATTAGQLFDVLAGESELRVVCLVTSPGVVDRQAAVTALCNRLFNDIGSAAVDRRMVLAPDGSGRPFPVGCVWPGWMCHLLLPEDAPGPSGVAAPVTRATEPALAIGHVAAGLVSIAGLWRGVPAPMPPSATGSDGQVRATRAFVRRVDADPAIERLVARLLDAEPHERVPRDRAEAPASEATHAARAVLAANTDLVDHHPYRMPPAPAARSVGAVEALRMLGEHVRSALFNVPGQLLADTRSRASTDLATAVHRAVFGTDSEADALVAVDGELARTPETVSALGRHQRGAGTGGGELFRSGAEALSAATASAHRAADVRNRTLDAANRPHVPVPPATSLWKTVVSTGTALIDGGTGGTGGTEGSGARAGSRAAVVVELSAVTPHPDESVALDGEPFPVGLVLPATDVHGLLTARELVRSMPRAERALSEDGSSEEAPVPAEVPDERTRLLAAIDRVVRTREQGYLWTIGTHLWEHLGRATRDVEHYRRVVPGTGAEHERTDLAEAEQRLRRRARNLLVGLVLCALLGWALTRTQRFGWVEAVSVAAAVAGLLVVATLLSFVAVQRIVFQLEHTLRVAGWEERHLPEALTHLVSEQARLAQLTAQCTAWGRVLADDVHRPFGVGATGDPLPDVDLGGSLPRSVELGTGCGLPLDRVVADLANRFYRPGWLAAWQERRRGTVLGVLAARRGLAEVPDPAADTLTQPNGPLSALVAAVDRPEVHEHSRAQGRFEVIASVGGMGFNDLVPRVRDDSGERSTSQFFAELLNPPASIRPFSQSHLSPAGAARSHELTPVDRTEVLASATTLVPPLAGAVVTRAAPVSITSDGGATVTTADELDQLLVRVDMARPTGPRDYRFFESRTTTAPVVDHHEVREGSFL